MIGMDSPFNFVDYAREQFNVELPPSPFWDDMGKLDLDCRANHQFVRSFCKAYPELACKHPNFNELVRPLCFAIVKHGAAQSDTQHWWVDAIADVLPLWTKNGVLDMSTAQAKELAPLLRPRLQYCDHSKNKIASMLFASKALWDQMGEETLTSGGHIKKDSAEEFFSMTAMTTLLHRYRPKDTSFDLRDTQNAYSSMCGLFQSVVPNLLEVSTVLMPHHHNTLAWRIAVSMCEAPARSQWMALEPALASLPLLADDPCAWAIISHLHERTDGDASGIELLRVLEEKNPKIGAAYRKVWPVVCTMYDAKERFEAAVALCKSTPRPMQTIELPSLSAD
jgi:hypothetical protein